MVEARELIVALIFGTAVALLFVNHRAVQQAIDDFKNNLPRGGPRPPTHPSPATDLTFPRRER